MDRYSKWVLTVIALCLVWLCIKDLSSIPAAQAQTETVVRFPKEMIRCNSMETTCWLLIKQVP